jgi:predicted house-cleaning noncanonical NTP pyrophosphatase (MazG superfamily)
MESAMSAGLATAKVPFLDFARGRLSEKLREKLVRDKLDDRIPPEELRIETDPAKVEALLIAKLGEELSELAESGYKDKGEFGDVIDVLRALAERAGHSPEELEVARAKKEGERGGFRRGLVYCPASAA